MPKSTDPEGPLKRLGGGRWKTRDARFTIEPQSGTWVVVDAEQTDDLGLPLVRGPFGSLTTAKEAINATRGTEPVASPLQARMEASRTRRQQPARSEPSATKPLARKRSASPTVGATTPPAAKPGAERAGPPAEPVRRPAAPPEPIEPRWLTDLAPTDRRRARGLIECLVTDQARDPQGIVRRDLIGNVASTAAYAVLAAIEQLDPEASAAGVARLLVEGRDERLGVRWRLVDDHGRPIPLDLDAVDRWATSVATATDRATAQEGKG
jgi:hypothetical protein